VTARVYLWVCESSGQGTLVCLAKGESGPRYAWLTSNCTEIGVIGCKLGPWPQQTTTDKVDAVRASTAATPLYDVPHRTMPTMTEWRDVTSDEVGKLINAAPNKSCQSDPAPTWLVKDMRGLLAPFLSMLFNKSLTTGCFPSQFKEAVVRPLLKKTGLRISIVLLTTEPALNRRL